MLNTGNVKSAVLFFSSASKIASSYVFNSCYCLSRLFLPCSSTRPVNSWVISWPLPNTSVRSSLQQRWRRFLTNTASYRRKSLLHVLMMQKRQEMWSRRRGRKAMKEWDRCGQNKDEEEKLRNGRCGGKWSLSHTQLKKHKQ